jgi:hypothetical protein
LAIVLILLAWRRIVARAVGARRIAGLISGISLILLIRFHLLLRILAWPILLVGLPTLLGLIALVSLLGLIALIALVWLILITVLVLIAHNDFLTMVLEVNILG